MGRNARDPQLKKRWELLVEILTEKFSNSETIDVEGILYLIGLQEFGNPHEQFKKEDNVNLIHIGVCVVLEPFGYYRFDYYDDAGWPHFELMEALPHLKPGEQNLLIKGAIVDYFVKQGVIS